MQSHDVPSASMSELCVEMGEEEGSESVGELSGKLMASTFGGAGPLASAISPSCGAISVMRLSRASSVTCCGSRRGVNKPPKLSNTAAAWLGSRCLAIRAARRAVRRFALRIIALSLRTSDLSYRVFLIGLSSSELASDSLLGPRSRSFMSILKTSRSLALVSDIVVGFARSALSVEAGCVEWRFVTGKSPCRTEVSIPESNARASLFRCPSVASMSKGEKDHYKLQESR